MKRTRQIHATAVAFRGRAVLLRGPSGSGKSDLALRLIARGWHLVADDRCNVRAEGGRLWVSAPPVLYGLIEARGVGIVRLPARARARVALLADLMPAARVPRLPKPAVRRILGVPIPRVALDAFAASAPEKLALALAYISTHRGNRANLRSHARCFERL